MWPFSSKPDPEEWKQIRSEINSPVLGKLEAIERTIAVQHSEVMRRLDDINNRQNYIRQEILNKVQAQDAQTRSEVAELYMHIQAVLAIVSQFSRPSLNGHYPIHERINVHIVEAVKALETLGQEHAHWLAQQQHSIQSVQEQLRIAAAHIFPEEEQGQVEG